MINFSNKYLTLAAIIVMIYMLSDSLFNFKNILNHEFKKTNLPAKHSLVIDPNKKKENYTLTEKLALMALSEQKKKELEEVQKSPSELIAKIGDKVFLEVDYVNSKETSSVKTFNVIVGEANSLVEDFIMEKIIGMKMDEEKIVENPKDKNDIREIKVLYIKRMNGGS